MLIVDRISFNFFPIMSIGHYLRAYVDRINVNSLHLC